MELSPLALSLAASMLACSGGKAKAVEDARRPAPAPGDSAGDAALAVPSATVRDYRVDTAVKTGDVSVRVEWKDTPQAMRSPGPPTRCKVLRTPAVTPATLWGVPDVVVALDVDHGKAFEAPTARIVLEDCAFAPRAIVAGPSVTIASAMREPAEVALQELARPLGGAALTGTPRAIALPITGHEVAVALEPGTVYSLAYGADDVAAIVSVSHPYVGITEASGALVLRDVPVGTHAVRAYLPARNGGDARTATATVTVTAGALAEVTLDIGRP